MIGLINHGKRICMLAKDTLERSRCLRGKISLKTFSHKRARWHAPISFCTGGQEQKYRGRCEDVHFANDMNVSTVAGQSLDEMVEAEGKCWS